MKGHLLRAFTGLEKQVREGPGPPVLGLPGHQVPFFCHVVQEKTVAGEGLVEVDNSFSRLTQA